MSSSYHHGNLRPALVLAAAELARAKGPDGVVLREVARQTGVSHNAAYRHFADREELLAEVATLAMDRLEAAMLARIAGIECDQPDLLSRLRLREVGRAYVGFALSEPGLFEVAFAAQTAHVDVPDCPESPASPESSDSSGPYGVLGDVLDEMVAAGAMPAARRDGADVVCWAAVHGFAVLHLHGPLSDLPAEIRDVTLEALLDTVERGLVGA